MTAMREHLLALHQLLADRTCLYSMPHQLIVKSCWACAGWQHHDSHHRAPEDMAQHQDIHQNTPEQPPEALDPHAGMHPHIVAAQEAYQKDIKRAKPDAAGFIY